MGEKKHCLYLFIYSALILGASASLVHAQTKNPVNESGSYYGLTEAEISALDSKSQVFVEKYKAGRADPSNREKFGKGSTRHFDTIFMHDTNGDGVTDHSAKAKGASLLEAGSNKAADNIVEKTPKNPADARNPDAAVEANLAEWRIKAEEACRKKYGDKTKYQDLNSDDIQAICYQPSPNLKNVGAAHGPDTDEHRSYQLTDRAKKAAEAAGKEYAKRAWDEAADYEGLQNVRRIPGKPGKVMVLATRNGKAVWEEKDVAANPDLIQSEVAFIEEEKEKNIRQNFKMLRARNLALSEFRDDHEFDDFVANSYKSTNPEDIKKADRAVAIMIAEKRGAATAKFCWKDDQAKRPEREATNDNPCTDPSKSRTVSEQMEKIQEGNTLSAQQKDQIRQNALNGLSANSRKAAEAEIKKIQNCMREDKWCLSKGEQVNGKSAFDELPAGDDPGSLYRDTRESLYKRSLTGVKGGLSDYEKSMAGDIDSSNHPDYKKFSQDMKKAKDDYERFLQEERAREAYSRKNGGNYKSPYLNKKNFDPARMNTRQLSGRNPRRGDATYSNRPYAGKKLPRARAVQGGSIGTRPEQSMRQPALSPPGAISPAPLNNPR